MQTFEITVQRSFPTTVFWTSTFKVNAETEDEARELALAEAEEARLLEDPPIDDLVDPSPPPAPGEQCWTYDPWDYGISSGGHFRYEVIE